MVHLICLGPASKVAADTGGGGRTEQFDNALPKAVGDDQTVACVSGATSSRANCTQASACAANATFEKAYNGKGESPGDVNNDNLEYEDIAELEAILLVTDPKQILDANMFNDNDQKK